MWPCQQYENLLREASLDGTALIVSVPETHLGRAYGLYDAGSDHLECWRRHWAGALPWPGSRFLLPCRPDALVFSGNFVTATSA